MKNIIAFVLIFLSFLISGYSQIKLNISSVSGNKNDTIQVPVKVTGFNNVVLIQYTFNYDSNVLAIVDIIKTANFDVDFATHVGNFFLKNGQLGFIWSSSTGFGQTIADGTTLFTLKFHLKGKECDSSFVKLGNHPQLPNEAQDGNFNNMTLTTTDGKMKINGSGCSGPPPPAGLEVIASNEIAPKGTVKCIKVTTRDFQNIQTGQFSMKWDKTVAKFESLTSGAFNLVFGQGYSPLPDSSGVGIVWYSELNPVTLPDDAVLFEVCLTAVGAPGSFTAITFDGTPAAIEFTDGNGDDVPVKFTTGRFTITDAPAQTLKIYYRDTTVNEGADFCIPIRVDNFVCVESFQFGIIFDTTKLIFKNISNINIPNFGLPNVHKIKDSIRFSWDSQGNPPTRNNGDFIFMICFQAAIPNCPFDTKITFTNLLNNTPMGFTDCNDTDFAVTKDEPVFTVACRNATKPFLISREGIPNPVRCYNDCNGSISGTQHTGGVGPFKYLWEVYVNGVFVMVGDSLDAHNLCPGFYRLCITDLGNANKDTCTELIEVKNIDLLELTAVITHVQVSNDGKIDLSVTGGTRPYDYTWYRLPNKPNPPRKEEDPMNLPAACYEVTVRDANGCTIVDTFCVDPPVFKVFDTVIVHNKCFGECLGSINLEFVGGRTPYFYTWENGDTKNPHDSLCAGNNYFVTVTDNSTPKATIILGPFTITQPDKIDITLDSIRKSSGTNGGIFVTVKGGTPKKVGAGAPYNYTWRRLSPPVQLGSSEDITNLSPGSYFICASDSFNCTQCDTFIVDSVGGPGDTLTVTLDIDEFNGGNAVSCRGKCDARISVLVTSTPKENKPYSYKWSHNPNLNSNVATGLCPGQSITVTVTDAANNSRVSNTLIIPDAPTITLAINKLRCATDSIINDGAYEAVTTGAVEPIQYRWCNGTITKTAFDLADGNCSLEITDVNGCTLSQTFYVCRNDVKTSAECYKGRLAISPNNDGLNDVLEIACVTDLDNSLTIFDRWGNLVYFKRNYANEWDGKNDDKDDLVEGTYLWVLKIIQSGKPDIYYKGTVTIVR